MVVVVDDGHLHRHPVEVHHPVDHQRRQRRCHPWRQGEACHRSHAADTLVPSRSWGVNTGDTPWMKMSPRTTWGPSRSWGINMGETPRTQTSSKPPWCPHVPSQPQDANLGTFRKLLGLWGVSPHVPVCPLGVSLCPPTLVDAVDVEVEGVVGFPRQPNVVPFLQGTHTHDVGDKRPPKI